MCGIAGYVQRRDDSAAIRRMTARMARRGPDGEGIHVESRDGWMVALGHRRLSIIDLGGGAQPLSNETAQVWISFNGEIYNFQSLRAELEQRGHRFASHCDTEAIVHHYEQYGLAGLPRLEGMFAFGIWDSSSGHLLLARDRAGIKPLYYAPLPCGGVVFASELTAILQHPDIPLQLDPQGLASLFFADYAHPPHTMVQGVRKLAPGHYVAWSAQNGLEQPKPFWSIDAIAPASELPDDARLSTELRNKLEEAVTAQLMSDVPLGVFLSGGIDSSTVAALAQRHARQPLQTFSIAFDDPQFDESAYARAVADKIGSRHIEQTFSEQSLLELIDAALDSLDEPIGDSSILPTYALSRLAARHVKVVLGGDGGDELWAGYPTYKAHRYARFYRKTPRFMRAALGGAISLLRARDGYQSIEWKAKRFVHRWDDDVLRRHLRWMSNTDLPDLNAVLPGCTPNPAALTNLHWPASAEVDTINRILAIDFATYLPGSVLTKVDRASMAHGLEVRPPMLDNGLIDFAFSLPSSCKLKGTTTKALLKRAAEGLLPAQVIHRRKKGFAIPLSRWLNGPLRTRVEEVLGGSPLWDLGLLNRDVFVEWSRQHAHRLVDRSRPLWVLLVLDHWYRAASGERSNNARTAGAAV